MSIAAIIGAGPLGGAIAHKLAGRDRFEEVRLIDVAAGVAAGKALDIQQASAVESFRTRMTSDDHVDAVAGAAVVVFADPAESAPDQKTDLATLEHALTFNRRAVIVCAGPTHRRLISQGVASLDAPRGRLIGSAPAAYQSAVRALVGVELRCSASQVTVAVLGRPPEQALVPWAAATARGFPLSSQLSAARLDRLQRRVSRLGPPGPYATASATARVCEAVVSSTRMKGLSVFYALDGELGHRGTTAAVSVELDATGITRVFTPSLTDGERVQLETILQRPDAS